MVNLDELGLDEDAKQMMERVADESGMDISQLQIPENKLKKLADAFTDEEFEQALRQAFKQIQD